MASAVWEVGDDRGLGFRSSLFFAESPQPQVGGPGPMANG